MAFKDVGGGWRFRFVSYVAGKQGWKPGSFLPPVSRFLYFLLYPRRVVSMWLSGIYNPVEGLLRLGRIKLPLFSLETMFSRPSDYFYRCVGVDKDGRVLLEALWLPPPEEGDLNIIREGATWRAEIRNPGSSEIAGDSGGSPSLAEALQRAYVGKRYSNAEEKFFSEAKS